MTALQEGSLAARLKLFFFFEYGGQFNAKFVFLVFVFCFVMLCLEISG